MGASHLFCSPAKVFALLKMVRLALIAVMCVAAVSAAPATPAPGGLDNRFLEATIPYIPDFTIKGVSVSLGGNISIALTDPDFMYDFKTTAKSVELTDKSFTLSVGHYKIAGNVAGLDISGDGSIKLAFKTHTASVTITGMKDATVAALITNFVKENQATLGDTVSSIINTNYGADINKYVVPMLNSICGDLPPPSA